MCVHSLLFAFRLLIRYQSLTQVAPYPDGLRVGTSVFKVPHSPMLCLISPGSIRRSAYGTQISFYRKRQSDRARSLPLFHTLQRLKKENKSHSLVGRHKRSKLSFAIAGFDAKTERTESEFRGYMPKEITTAFSERNPPLKCAFPFLFSAR